MQSKEHKITHIEPGSIADQLDIRPGDFLLSVNGAQIEDVFDYHYQLNEDYLTIVTRRQNGEEWEYEIEKDYEEDLGIEFENGLMDDYRSCSNKCIFCFIDQMPPGMRKTLYFKDDDARLSFLQGNYITLTNMKDHDIDRIITYKLAPVNISVHTMDAGLRCRMLNNRFAGEALKKMQRLYEAGIEMNGQIVLCRGVNDKEALAYSIEELTKYLPHMRSVSVVPVGLTRYRDGLYPLEPFTKEDAKEVLGTIHRWQDVCMRQWGTHFIHASDEWYLLAEEELPEADRYDGYLQLENGVGMLRLLLEEFHEAMRAGRADNEQAASGAGRGQADNEQTASGAGRGQADNEQTTSGAGRGQADNEQAASGAGRGQADNEQTVSGAGRGQADNEQTASGAGRETTTARGAVHTAASVSDLDRDLCGDAVPEKVKKISAATGMLAAPFIKKLADEFMESYPDRRIEVFAVRNDFFGERITVSGLLTGQDLLHQLKGRDLGDTLLLPCSLLRSGEDVFLDDMTVLELKNALQVNIVIVNSNGQALYDAFYG